MMSAPARWEYLRAIHGRYRQAAPTEKGWWGGAAGAAGALPRAAAR